MRDVKSHFIYIKKAGFKLRNQLFFYDLIPGFKIPNPKPKVKIVSVVGIWNFKKFTFENFYDYVSVCNVSVLNLCFAKLH